MGTRSETVVTLAGEAIDPDRAFVFADDPMVVRGDGVFETLLVRDGRVCVLDAHLDRFARSAAIAALPPPDPARWRSAVRVAIENWAGIGDGVLRLTYGRGRDGAPTAFVTVSDLPARVFAARRDGVSAMTLERGVGGDAPWSVAGAKSVSYALNTAALRHAMRLGFGDVVFLGSNGCVLEGPRSSVVIVTADGTMVTPPDTLPILPGTTVAALFEAARRARLTCERRILQIGDLSAAQEVWLLSSVTLAARVHALNGVALAAETSTVGLAALVDEAVDEGAWNAL